MPIRRCTSGWKRPASPRSQARRRNSTPSSGARRRAGRRCLPRTATSSWPIDTKTHYVTLRRERSEPRRAATHDSRPSFEARLRRAPQDDGHCLALLPDVEIFQVGRRLVLAHRHDGAVAAEEVALLADGDVGLAFDAVVFEPPDLVRLLALPGLAHAPGPRQRVVDRGHLID